MSQSKECAHCGDPFTQNSTRQKFCKGNCRKLSHAKQQRELAKLAHSHDYCEICKGESAGRVICSVCAVMIRTGLNIGSLQ